MVEPTPSSRKKKGDLGTEKSKETAQPEEPVWTFRGYELKSSEFNTAMVHFFRAEISRANVWRQRLDATTNWAVLTTGAAITIAFSETGFHGVIILNTLLVMLFLMIEARRYRYYELWSSRVRLLETDFFAAMLVPPFQPAPDWAESLAENLLHPDFPISMWEAIGRRFRRNYLWIYLILGLAWFSNTMLYPLPATSVENFFSNATIGMIPGWVVFTAGVIFYLGLILMGVFTSGLHQATGEVLPRYSEALRGIPTGMEHKPGKEQAAPWFRFGRKRQQLVAFIITDEGKLVSAKILEEMKRGVTALHGTGMYTGQERAVLLCALTVTEVNHLKSLVHQADANAFVIVTPAQEVLGKGFLPLEEK
jgi:uncharacterized membrane protein